MPDEVAFQIWRALQLPARVEEAVATFSASMAKHEDMFLAKLQKDREDFAAEIAKLTAQVQVRRLALFTEPAKALRLNHRSVAKTTTLLLTSRTMPGRASLRARPQDWANIHQEEMVDEYVALAQHQLNTIKQMMAKGEHINKQELLAGWETSSYASLHVLRRQLVPYLGEQLHSPQEAAHAASLSRSPGSAPAAAVPANANPHTHMPCLGLPHRTPLARKGRRVRVAT